MPVTPQTRPRLMPGVAASRFRLGARSYALSACVCLYRHEIGAIAPAEYLVLTPDMRFAHVARPPAKRELEIDMAAPAPVYAAIELNADEARDFLTAHGEGDLVDDFADLFHIVQKTTRLVDDALRINRLPAHNTAH